MLVTLYFLVACAFAVWLLPDAVKECRNVPEPIRTMVGVLLFGCIVMWPAMVVFVYTNNGGRWK